MFHLTCYSSLEFLDEHVSELKQQWLLELKWNKIEVDIEFNRKVK